MNEFVNRVLKPVSIPLAAAAFIGVLVFSFSRILLAVPEVGSTTLALLISAEIVGVCGVIAAGSRVKGAQKLMLGVLSLGLIAGGGASAAIGIRDIEAHKAGIPIAAKDIKFDLATLSVPADEEFVLEFHNNDASIQHNVAIYTDDTAAEALFRGALFSGVATQAYDVPPIPAGSYFFQCDVHPAMKGTVEASEGDAHGGPQASASPSAPGPGGSPSSPPAHGGATDVTVTANQIQFDTSRLDLAADTPVTLTLINQEAQPHNLSIYQGTDASGRAVLQEDFFIGPDQRTWTIPATAPGDYYFQCDVHPAMKGTAIFH